MVTTAAWALVFAVTRVAGQPRTPSVGDGTARQVLPTAGTDDARDENAAREAIVPPRPAQPDAYNNPETPEDAVARAHLSSAPSELQQQYALVARREAANFASRAEEAVAKAENCVEAYLEYLILSRDARTRQLAHLELLRGNGVLSINGLKPPQAGDRPMVSYMGVTSVHGRQADLIVWVGQEGEPADPMLSAFSASIEDVAMAALATAVSTFHQRSRSERAAGIEVYRKTGRLPGFAKDVMFVVGHRLIVDADSATLAIRP
jgi:hypothetical protein